MTHWETSNPILFQIAKDEWAVKAIRYLVRKDYSSEEVIELMIEIGIKQREREA